MSVVRTPVSRLAQFVNGRAFKPDDFTEEGLPVVRIRELLNPEVEPDRFDGAVSKRNRIQNGDLLFAWSATLAVRFWNRGDAVLNQHLFNVIPQPGVSKPYLRWALDHAIEDLAGHMHGSAMTHITLEMLKNVYVALPTAGRQQQISEYLDRETGQIDALITKQEQLVEALTERRQAVIAQAVTHGLDPTVELKDSGVEWLGLIPMHWVATSIKHVVRPGAASIKPGPFGSDLTARDMTGSDIKVYNQKSVLSREMSGGEERISNEKYQTLRGFDTVAGDVLVTSRGSIGRAIELPIGSEPGIFHPCIIRVRVDGEKLRPSYLVRLLNDVDYLREQFKFASNSTTIDVIYSGALRDCRIALPPTMDEQIAIEVFVGDQADRIDSLVAKAREVVDVLKERRQALISAAVTGKIDVRGL